MGNPGAMIRAISSPMAASKPVRVVTDTSELRWFARGRLPVDVMTWFSHCGELGAIEKRCDTYRLDGRGDVGVKRRGHGVLELKVRHDVDDSVLTLGLGITGRPESWRRWSPADGLCDLEPSHRWVDVAKTIVRRRFLDDGVEVAVHPVLPVGGFCDVEVVALVVDGATWWSLGLSTYGCDDVEPDLMRPAWKAVADGRTPPSAMVSALGAPQGYPAWLIEAVPGEAAWPRMDTGHPEAAWPDRSQVGAGAESARRSVTEAFG